MRLKLKNKQKLSKDDIKEIIRFAFIPTFIEEENTWIWLEKYVSIYGVYCYTSDCISYTEWKFIKRKFYGK